MIKATEFVMVKGAEPCSLIHDGLLVHVSSASFIDCKALGAFVRNGKGLKCHFAMSP
jgi:hypothetical protein